MNTRHIHPTDTVDERAWQEQERVWQAVREGRPAAPDDAGEAAIYAALATPPGIGPGEDFAALVAAQAGRTGVRPRQVRRFGLVVAAVLVLVYACAIGAGLLLDGAKWADDLIRAGSAQWQGGWLPAALVCVALFAVIEPLTRGAPLHPRD